VLITKNCTAYIILRDTDKGKYTEERIKFGHHDIYIQINTLDKK